jgi:hypothetical protein
MSVLIEAKHRRGELAMYVLPKGLESAWVAARGKGLVFRTGKHGSALVGSCRSTTTFRQIFTHIPLVDCDGDGNGHGAFVGLLSTLIPNFKIPCRARIRFVPSVRFVVREIDVFPEE